MTYIPTITDKEIATVKFALRNHQGAGWNLSDEQKKALDYELEGI